MAPYSIQLMIWVRRATARNAHLPIAACSWGFVPKEQLVAAEPDYLVDKPDQILSLILKPQF